jgi:hypothetical protein
MQYFTPLTKQRLNALTVGFFSCPYIMDQNCLLFPYNIVNNPYGANPDSVSIIVAFKFADIFFLNGRGSFFRSNMVSFKWRFCS